MGRLMRNRQQSNENEIAGEPEEVDQIPEEKIQSPPQAGSIVLWKYFELYRPEVDKYHKAYLSEQYRGVMKTPDEWSEEIKQYIKE